MQISSLFSESIRSLMANRLRSGLAMLGIVIGVGSVIVMIAVGQGGQISVKRSIESLGSNIVMISKGDDSRGGSGANSALTIRDVHALQESPLFSGVTPMTEPKLQDLLFNSRSAVANVVGSTPDFFHIREWDTSQGSIFTDEDVAHNPRVIVIGQELADTLFNSDYAVGKTVRIAGIPLTVVGVLKKKGHSPDGSNQDTVAIMPLIIVQQRILGNPTNGGIEKIMVKLRSGTSYADAGKEISRLLRSVRKLKPEQEDTFKVLNMSELATGALKTGKVMALLLASIASISLIVGGIGIMNIMFVCVSERTHEIGIRKSIGARKSDIMRQFLLEALLIALIGSGMGIILGLTATEVVSGYFGVATYLSGSAIAISVGTAVLVGLVFGYSPARKAAGLTPVEALRH